MKNSLVAFCFALLCLSSYAQHDHQDSAKTGSKEKSGNALSPHTSAMAMIGAAHIHVDYSSPSVRGRIIFGGLVGYNTVWQAGAHKATWIETDRNLAIAGKILPAGKYGFFVIPGKETWKIMFNSRWDQHGKDQYNEVENELSMEVTPGELHENQESLVYQVKETDENKGMISLAWEKIKIEIPFEVVN